MNCIFRYTAMMISLMLVGIHVLILPAEAMTESEHHVDPIIELAQGDARRDAGLNLSWLAYGAGCWMFAVIHANINNPTVPSNRLLGKSPKYINAYTDEYKRSVKKQRIEMSAIGWGVSLAATFWLWSIFAD